MPAGFADIAGFTICKRELKNNPTSEFLWNGTVQGVQTGFQLGRSEDDWDSGS